jgi:hypothetical protein
MRRRLAVHLGEKARDRIGADRDASSGEQFANHSERRALLPQLDDAIPERHQLCVTRRRRRRERSDSLVETLRARCDVGGFAHEIGSELAAS